MKSCFCFLILSILGSQLVLGSSVKDSFLLLLDDPNTDLTIKAEVSNKLVAYYLMTNKDSTNYFLDLAMDYAKQSGDSYEIFNAKILHVSSKKNEWGFDSTVIFYENLLGDPDIENFIDIKKTVINDLGVLYGDHGDQLKGTEYAIQALEISRSMGDSLEIGRSIINIGIHYFNMSLNELALEKFKECEKIFEALDHKSFQTYALNGIVNVFDNIGELDSAFHYSEKMMEAADLATIADFKVTARVSLGQILNSKKRYKESLEYFQEAYTISLDVGDELNSAYCLCNLGAAHYYLEDYQEALEYYEKAISYQIFQNNHLATQSCAKELAYTYEKLGRPSESIKYLKEYIDYQDTVLLKENKEVVASIEAKYNSVVQEAELDKRKAEIDNKTYQRNLLTGGLGLSLMLGGSLIWGLLNRSNKNKKITQQHNDLQNQKIQTLEQEKKLLSMSSLLEGQENERIRIAKDLHDGLGGLLTTVKAHFGKIQSEIEKVENLDIYKIANQMIDKAHDEVRRISHNLMPADLRAGGLPIAIRQLVHELKTVHETKTDFEFIGFNDSRFDENIELSAYRITQELINNLLKYAKADQVFIQLSKFEDELQVIVEDNGIGFNYDDALSSNGLGLKSILSRVEQFNGHIDVVTAPGKGTSVTINIPIKELQ